MAGADVQAQDESDQIEYYRYKGQDTVRRSALTQAQIRLRNIRPTEKFDLLLNWGFLLSGNMPDTVPVRTSASGTRFVGLSFNYLLSEKVIFKLQPGFSFFKVTFDQKSSKTFPSDADSANREKLRAEYFEVGAAFAYVIQADTAKGKIVSSFEAGAVGGRLIGSSYKLTRTEDGQTVKIKIPGVDDINPWRAGLFAKLTYRFVGIWAFYRLTPLFRDLPPRDGFRYPSFPAWELGFSVIL